MVTKFNIKLFIIAEAWKQPKNFKTGEMVSMMSGPQNREHVTVVNDIHGEVLIV